MTATFGRIDEFEEGKEDWIQYVERLEHFFEANNVSTDAKKRSILLSVMGPSAYKLLRSLVSPDKPGEKSYEELVTAMKLHHNPVPSEIVQRYKFNCRFRRDGESVAKFVSELRSLAEFCNYRATLDDMLRDRLVCGIHDDHIQRRLLAEEKLTFQKAMEIAVAMETAASNSRMLQGSLQPSLVSDADVGEVHKLQSTVKPPTAAVACYRCGKSNHLAQQCRFKAVKCHGCGKMGHLVKVCRSTTLRKRQTSVGAGTQEVQHLQVGAPEGDGVISHEEEEYSLFHVRSEPEIPLKVLVGINQQQVEMEVDTGASLSVLSEKTFRKFWPEQVLQKSSVKIRTYTGESLKVVGCMEADITYGDQKSHVSLLVVEGQGPNLLGRDLLRQIQLNWHEIFCLQWTSSLQCILQQHKDVFKEELGTMKGFQAKLYVDGSITPRFCKAHSMSYAMRQKVDDELQRLQKEGIIEPVQFAEWAAPIVPILKADKKSVRICGDYKLTVNRACKLDNYPIPRIEDLFATLSGGKFFTKLDLSQAYQQLLLDEEAKKFVVINTQRGLFQYNRLPFGVSSAPGIFQRAMENLLQGIPNVIVYIDDILVSGASEVEHLAVLRKVLSRLKEVGLRLKKHKCVFMTTSVTFLGHKIDAQGLHPLESKVRAVKEAPTPCNVTELKAYLGLLTYYGRFLPNRSMVLAPLYTLLRAKVPWRWTTVEAAAFKASKQLLLSSQCLVHYNRHEEVVLSCDASAYGIGAVLSHRFRDGTEKPIGFVSRTLSPAERNYSQLEKEGLACVFGIKRFHSYLFGRHFYLCTDHKPLLTLFKESRAVNPQASARIQRWALTLSMYEYTLQFKRTEDHANADALSRLPLPEHPQSVPLPVETIFLMECLESSPITAVQIRSWTKRDPLLARVVKFIKEGWPEVCAEDLKPFSSRKLELSVEDDCILWGSRVVVPPPGRSLILQELHEGHPGISRMKSLARMVVWWPGMDKDIEDKVKSCHDCQQDRPKPAPTPLHPWEYPSRPWARVHIDLAGPCFGHMFLVLIDAHTKWLEVNPLSSTTSKVIIENLRMVFARLGLPETVVSDNASYFVSQEFEDFLQRNGIRHTTSAPYHPSSNGLAERAVQVFKTGMKRMTVGSLNDRISRFLFAYRRTPQTTTGHSPAELLMGRNLRSHLDLIHPDVSKRVVLKQHKQKEYHDQRAVGRSFTAGDQVYVRNFGRGHPWLPGRILESTGPVSFRVQLENGQIIWRRHLDQIRKLHDVGTQHATPMELVTLPLPNDLPEPATGVVEEREKNDSSLNSPTPAIPSVKGDSPNIDTLDPPMPMPEPVQVESPRYPSRIRKPPKRFGFD